jgi:ATP-dependent helicase HrpB
MLAGFLDHLARRVDQGTLKCVLSDNSIAEIGSESLVHESPILFYGAIRQSKSSQLQSYPKMTMNTQVEVEWIKSDYPDQVKQVQIGEYIPHLKRVECFEVLNYRKLELSKLRIDNSDPMISGFALANAAVEEKFPLPKWNHQLEQTIARFNLVALSIPELELLPIERKEKIEILSKAFQGIHLAKEAQNVEILPHLMDWIAKDTWEWIDEMAPVKKYIINEKPIKLVYTDPLKSGSKKLIGPVAQINLLDCFELDEHPTVLEDRIPILLRLLTPDGKKLSETENWKRFKIKEYPMQKASLKSKYPGKFWP